MFHKIGSSIFLQINKKSLINTNFIKSIQLKKNVIEYEFNNMKIDGHFSGHIVPSVGEIFGNLNYSHDIYSITYKDEDEAQNIFNTLINVYPKKVYYD
jgi:hypothetical protein